MLDAAAQVFVRLGASVWVNAHGDNLVRTVAQPRGTSSPAAEVHAQGLPNLLHELVHALLAGCIDDDHGIDYHAIPFDLDTAKGRDMLWEELSCSLLSCAYLRGELQRRGIAPLQRVAQVDAWFREQVEIQPVFYGMEGDATGFVGRVAALLQTHAAEAKTVVDRAYEAVERALAAAGAAPGVAQPPLREALAVIWTRAIGGAAQGSAEGSARRPEPA